MRRGGGASRGERGHALHLIAPPSGHRAPRRTYADSNPGSQSDPDPLSQAPWGGLLIAITGLTTGLIGGGLVFASSAGPVGSGPVGDLRRAGHRPDSRTAVQGQRVPPCPRTSGDPSTRLADPDLAGGTDRGGTIDRPHTRRGAPLRERRLLVLHRALLNSRLGRFRCFLNDARRCCSCGRLPHRTVVIGPDDPDRFMREVKAMAGLA